MAKASKRQRISSEKRVAELESLITSNCHSRSVLTAALYLEPGILPIKCEIEIRQLLFLKKILDRNENDPVSQVY